MLLTNTSINYSNDLSLTTELGFIKLFKTYTLTINDIDSSVKIHEIKSNCSCVKIIEWVLFENTLKISIEVNSKSDLVVFQEKSLYLWEIKKEEKILVKTINLKYI